MMQTSLTALAMACIAVTLSAQNAVPNGNFESATQGWTNTSFNDPQGTHGIGSADVAGTGKSQALFADFHTLTSVRSCTYISTAFALPAGSIGAQFDVMWEKAVTIPIPYPSVNRVEMRLKDSAGVVVWSTRLLSPNQTGLMERRSFSGTIPVASAGQYQVELFLRHSNLAGLPFKCWVDNVVVGTADTWVFGNGCLGSNGTPAISTPGPCVTGSNFQIDLSNAAQGAAFLGMGASNKQHGSVQLPFALGAGCDILVALTATASFTVGATGQAQAVLPVPNDPSIIGLVLYGQWLVIDPSVQNPFSLATSNALGFVVQ